MGIWNDLQTWCEDYGFALTEENGEYVIWGTSAFDEDAVESITRD